MKKLNGVHRELHFQEAPAPVKRATIYERANRALARGMAELSTQAVLRDTPPTLYEFLKMTEQLMQAAFRDEFQPLGKLVVKKHGDSLAQASNRMKEKYDAGDST